MIRKIAKIVTIILIFSMVSQSSVFALDTKKVKVIELDGVKYTITTIKDDETERIVQVKNSNGFIITSKLDKKSKKATFYENNAGLTRYSSRLHNKQPLMEIDLNSKKDTVLRTRRVSYSDKEYNSEYYDDYSYNRDGKTVTMIYELNTSKNSVTTKEFLSSKTEDRGTIEYEIHHAADRFLEQIKRADEFTERVIELLAPSHIAGGSVGTFFDEVSKLVGDYSDDKIVSTFLAFLELSPATVAVEVVTLAPVIATNLYNCRTIVDLVDDLNDDLHY